MSALGSKVTVLKASSVDAPHVGDVIRVAGLSGSSGEVGRAQARYLRELALAQAARRADGSHERPVHLHGHIDFDNTTKELHEGRQPALSSEWSLVLSGVGSRSISTRRACRRRKVAEASSGRPSLAWSRMMRR